MSDFREDLGETFYAPDTVYAEQLSPPLNLNPVFQKALEKQLIVRGTVISDLSEASLNNVMSVMGEETSILDQEAFNQGLYGKPVTLTGLSVKLPGLKRHYESDSSLILPLSEGPAVDDLNLSHETGGIFYGFGTRLDIVSDGDTIESVRPVLVYQVKVGSFTVLHGTGHVFATGDVGEAQIEFLDDIMKQRLADVLTILMSHDDEIVLGCINNINLRLAKKTSYTAGDIRYIGQQMNRILGALNTDKETKYIDAIVNLVSCYVDLDKKYSIATETVLRKSKSEGEEIIELIPGNPLVAFEGVIDGFSVMANHTVIGQELRWTNKNTTYGVFHTSEATWYVRLTDFQSFK